MDNIKDLTYKYAFKRKKLLFVERDDDYYFDDQLLHVCSKNEFLINILF